ncbi:MAG: HD family phosphohydrolase [Gemmatimonadota bacterium]|nr:MAG: HD family phosphohydrolase [Gemmatimonadota bacterium]
MSQCLIYAQAESVPPSVTSLGDAVEVRELSDLASVEDTDLPTVVLLDGSLVQDGGELSALPQHAMLLSVDGEAREAAENADLLFLDLADLADPQAQLRAIRSAARASGNALGARRARREMDDMRGELLELNKIGIALMSERNLEDLLGMILTQARILTNSDAGSLYLTETNEEGVEHLHFLRAQNDSLPHLPTPDFTLPLEESSIAGFVASRGEPLIIEDSYCIAAEAPYSFNRAFDDEVGYRAKSMLVVPLMNRRNRVVGVVQLINRKSTPEGVIHDEASAKEHVLPYGSREAGLVQSLAGQAAVSIENSQLYQDIENLFDGFIKAAVTAIDQRDPTTSGHSVRVAALTCDIAEVADTARDGPFKDTGFTKEQMRELRFAGLLHDFGKVGVRENVLVKAKKLPPVMLDRIESRFDLIRRTLEAGFHGKRAQFLLDSGRDGFDSYVEELDAEFQASLKRLDEFQVAIRESNEPRVLPEASAEILNDIAATTFRDFRGNEVPYITDDELHFLSIPKGSLDPAERQQIESHVTHTYHFLTQIPWTDDLACVAEIAHGHHEKLDGTGYPRRIGGADIPVQTRIMTVADIFDALTASDRPYKRALSADRALEILKMESDGGQLDPDIVQLLIGSEVYHKILEEDWRGF